MIGSKSTMFLVMMFVALLGLAVIVGCGNSAEEKAMMDFLKLFSDTVDQYAAADDGEKAELKAKLDSFHSKWSDMEMQMDGRLTPNDLEKFDKQYKEIEDRYRALAEKS
jgi:hypothetical protein